MGFRRIFPGGAQASRESKVDVGSTETEDRKPTCSYVQVSNGAASAEAGGLIRNQTAERPPEGVYLLFFLFCESGVCKKFIYNSQKNHLDSTFFCGILYRKKSTGTVPVRGSCRGRAKHRTCAILPKGGDIPCAFTSGRSCPIRPISTI